MTDALQSLHQLFFVVERLDQQAHNPGPDGMVQVTAIMWRDQISPHVAAVRRALDEEPGRMERPGRLPGADHDR